MFSRFKWAVLGSLFSFSAANAQFNEKQQKFYLRGYFDMKSGPFTMAQPFLGGFNSPQFQVINLNNDSLMDLLIFDRNDNKLLPFVRRGKGEKFDYAPQFEPKLPKGNYWYKTADLNSDGKLDIFTLNEIGNLVIHKNITEPTDSFARFRDLGSQIYRNQYDTTFFNLYNPLGLSKTDLPEISDIDGDGDLDIVFYDALNLSYSSHRDVRAEKGWNKDTFEFQIMDYCFGYFNEGFNNQIELGKCVYKDKLRPRHTGGASLLMFDADEDGDKEMVIANVGFKHMYMLQNGKAQYQGYWDTMIQWDSIFPRNTRRGADYFFPAGYLADIDGDSIQDLMLAPNGFSDVKEANQCWLYKNHGKNNKPDFRFVKDNFLAEKNIDFGARTAPAFCDYDADGDYDLFVASNGDFEVTGGISDRITLLKNTGTPKKPVFEITDSDYLNLSQKHIQDMTIRFGDVDGDKDQDLLIGEINGRVLWYRNTAGAGNLFQFELADSNLMHDTLRPLEDHSAPAVYNYNGDSLPDMLVGRYNGHLSLYVNEGSVGNPKFRLVERRPWQMKANEWRENTNPEGFMSYGYASPEIVDIDNDGSQEILLGTAHGVPRLYKPTGRSIYDSLSAEKDWAWQMSFGDSVEPDFGSRIIPAAADIDGDSIPELVFGLSRGGLVLLTSRNSQTGIGVKKLSHQFTWSLFPNPAGELVTIRRPNGSEQWQITIYDATGREVQKSKLLPGEHALGLSVARLKSGVYTVTVANGEAQSCRKLLIQNR
ncbi:MAG: T9SS type A sorting domain-containing protein [Bacteroidetes bacterium]|nr:T9SS type A sorting domain-containing protein [Bacteroidota bacterium]